MKLLLIHADHMEWVPTKKALKAAEQVEKMEHQAKETLVVFTAVEKQDEKHPSAVTKQAVKEILEVAGKVHPKNIVLYPYAHLSSDLGSPEKALSMLKSMESHVKKTFPVKRAAFGWYKAFSLKAKGHPLAELSKQVSAQGVKKGDDQLSEAVKKEQTLKSTWYIIEPSGKRHRLSLKNGRVVGFDFSKHKNLQKFAQYELAKSREVKEEPPHIKLMRRLQLVNYEGGSDPGHFRYMPNGKLMKALIEEWTTQNMQEYGALEVETPIMYDHEHPSLKSYLNRFPARQYSIQTPNKSVFLRFSACFGQFLMLHDTGISYRNLPLPLYELTRYSFRVEQHGELAGLRRLRAFTMPDCHCLVKDITQAKSELLKRFDVALNVQKGFGLGQKNLELAIRFVEKFYKENEPFAKQMIKKWGRPVLVEMWDKQFFYFAMKYEFNFVDALDKAAALTTDQIDSENAERYGITFMDKDNKKKFPLILHLSPSGAIERVIYAMLEKAFMEQKAGKNPVFPLWLSPTQVRICPVNDTFIKDAEALAQELGGNQIRVDVDDRTESVQKKIRDAESEWIPLTIVLGEKEKKSGSLAVRFRASGEVKNMKSAQMIQHVTKETKGKPFRPLPLPQLLTKRPVFVG